MIRLTQVPKPLLILSPRAGQRPSLELELIYGHVCPLCNNVIQAFFYTDQKVDLWPFEETTVLSQGEKNMGEILKIFPDSKAAPGDTCYRSYFHKTEGRNAQRIILKNHLLRLNTLDESVFNRDKLWEVGERTCPLTGIFSIKEDVAIKDLGMVLKMSVQELEGYNIPKISELIPNPQGTPDADMFKWVTAVGVAPPMLLLPRETASQGYSYYLKILLAKFRKPVEKSA